MDLPWPILVVSSNHDCLRAIPEVLQSWGLETLQASTLSAARATLAERPIRMVFCDEQIEGGTFRDLLENLGTRSARARLVVLIHDAEQYDRVIESGAFGALMVPCQRSDIQWIVIRALKAPEKSNVKAQGLRHG